MQNKLIYYLFVEQTIINDSSQDFVNAMQQLFAVYDTLNMCYPAKATKTLLFFQRVFAEYFTERTRGE
jgi:hypothetical protein